MMGLPGPVQVVTMIASNVSGHVPVVRPESTFFLTSRRRPSGVVVISFVTALSMWGLSDGGRIYFLGTPL
jgi:hypothetical protein